MGWTFWDRIMEDEPFFMAPPDWDSKADTRPMYGWYSREATRGGFGTSFYRHELGHEVEITNVCRSSVDSGCGWEDMTFLGRVTEWVRVGKYQMNGPQYA